MGGASGSGAQKRQRRARTRTVVMIAVTGTPGTGKKSVAAALAGVLKAGVVELNSLASSGRTPRARGEGVVDVALLRSELINTDASHGVVAGHLVPDVLRRGEPGFVAVLRCEPTELKKRLSARRYAAAKLLENVEAELIGVVLDASVRTFGAAAVHEYDTTGQEPADVAARIARDYRSGAEGGRSWTDWTLDYDSSTKLRSLLSSPSTEPAST